MLTLCQMDDNPESMREKLLDSYTRPILKVMDEKGVTDELLVEKLKEELDATFNKEFQYEGSLVEGPARIAWDIRQRARQDAHKLKGHYPAERKHVSVDGGLPVIPLSEEDKLELEAMKETLRNKAKNSEG